MPLASISLDFNFLGPWGAALGSGRHTGRLGKVTSSSAVSEFTTCLCYLENCPSSGQSIHVSVAAAVHLDPVEIPMGERQIFGCDPRCHRD